MPKKMQAVTETKMVEMNYYNLTTGRGTGSDADAIAAFIS